MDECWLLEEMLTDDVDCFEPVVVVAGVLDDEPAVTVTVLAILHSEVSCDARGAAAASPNREVRKILECILSQ